MPLVAYKNLPGFQKLRDEGRIVLDPTRAHSQDIRELHIGLLNMMDDKALQATEWQFFRLIGESNQIAQFYIHPFSLPQLKRSDEARAYIEQNYESFEDIRREGLDALIITGANVSGPNLEDQDFWEPLQEVMDWAWNNVTSTICSCLATHAYMQFAHGKQRIPLGKKKWGVYKHRVIDREHPVVRGMNTVFDVPHSRHNRISVQQFDEAEMPILVWSEEAGTHLATSPDGFRVICLQGHPEYDTVSLFKEYLRDLALFQEGKLPAPPPYPDHYLTEEIKALLPHGVYPSPEVIPEIEKRLENTWSDSAKSVLGNWIGQVYQVTNVERSKQFMDGVDPSDPLGLKGRP